MDSIFISLAASTSWVMPAALRQACSEFMNAHLLLRFDTLSTSGGSLMAKLQSAPTLSQDDNAWRDIASLGSPINAAGPQVLIVNDAASVPMTGHLRLKFSAISATVDFSVRADLLLKHSVESAALDWLPATALSFPGSGSQVMPADQWVDCSRFLHAFVLCEFALSSGTATDLTVVLQTAPSESSDATAWVDVVSSTMSATSIVLDGRASASYPPMGVLRLKFSAAAAVSGTLRCVLLMKES